MAELWTLFLVFTVENLSQSNPRFYIAEAKLCWI